MVRKTLLFLILQHLDKPVHQKFPALLFTGQPPWQDTLELQVTPPQPPTYQLAHSHGTTQTGKGEGMAQSSTVGIIIPMPVTGILVRSGDLKMLMGLLHKCAYRWREIGFALNFQYSELENISSSNQGATTQQLLTELLSRWSQWPTADHPDDPTMERLRDALRSGLVELGAVANDLYELRHTLPSKQTAQ